LSPLDNVTRTEQITRVPRSAQDVFSPSDSDHEHFEVRSHHPIDMKRLRDSVKLVQIQSAASSRLDERFEDDIHSNLVAESEAVGYGSGHGRNCDSLALDAMLLDSKVEERR
jgi:hypothetical protein